MMFKEVYNRIKQNKDAKTLVENFTYLSLLQVASYIFPIFTIPYLARIIGVDSFGKIAFASAVIGWFTTFTGWGFHYTGTRDVARCRDNKKKVSEIFSNVTWARCFLMIFAFGILLILISVIPKFKENQDVILVTFILIPGQIMFPSWFFQAIERMKYVTILNLLSKIIFTISIFIFIKEKSDFILQPLLISMGYVVSGIIAMYFILIKWKIKLHKPCFVKIIKTIKGSTDVFINNIMPNFYNSFSTLLLGFWGGSISVGILDSGKRFVSVTERFINIISTTFYPFLSRKIDKHNLFVKLNIIISLIATFLLFLFAPILIKFFFTKEFYDSIIVLRIVSFSIFFFTLNKVYGTNYLIIQGYEKQLRTITMIGSLIGFALSFPLVYYFDYLGAAITITLTMGILGLSVMIKAKKIIKCYK